MNHNDTTRPTFITLSSRNKDITGQRFGRLVALGPVALDSCVRWLCQCDCGNTAVVSGHELRRRETESRSRTKSCGCLRREASAQRLRTHGMWGKRIYGIWRGIIDRCTNPNIHNFADYGGRGVIICEEWRHDFQAFHAYVSRLPNYAKKGFSIDRVDNEGSYVPGNVRWATQAEQNRNRRISRMITYQGKTQCLQAWEEEQGFRKGTLQQRLDRGWATERAMTQTVSRNGRRKGQ